MEEFERLLNATFPFVEDLLKKYKEFFPLATVINENDSIVQVGTYDGDEHPESHKVIEDLKMGLRSGAKKGSYRAIAIFYDVKISDPTTNEKTDAVAVFVENIKEPTAYKLYFPYKLSQSGDLTFTESWKEVTEKEIFNN